MVDSWLLLTCCFFAIMGICRNEQWLIMISERFNSWFMSGQLSGKCVVMFLLIILHSGLFTTHHHLCVRWTIVGYTIVGHFYELVELVHWLFLLVQLWFTASLWATVNSQWVHHGCQPWTRPVITIKHQPLMNHQQLPKKHV